VGDNVYPFVRKVKPLRPSKYNVYIRDVDTESGAVIKNEERDVVLRLRCSSVKYRRNSLKNRIDLTFREGEDLKTLQHCLQLAGVVVVTVETLGDKDRVISSMHLLCTLDDFEQSLDEGNKNKIVDSKLTLIIKSRLTELDFEERANEYNKEDTGELE
jgi:hypothetical protein